MENFKFCAAVLAMLKNIMIWEKVYKNAPSKICERQSLKNFKGYGLRRCFIAF